MSKRVPRILVVDDDRTLRELLRLHLQAEGYEVQLAADAIEAGYAILKSAPDLLLVDVNMPYLNGIDFAAALVADQTIPVFPFVFLSSDETRVDQGRRLGAAAYLFKPIVKGRLIDAVDCALAPERRQVAA